MKEYMDKNLQNLVFIVDDNSVILTMAASALQNDFKVLTMSSAQRMFSLFEKKKPDIILLDIEMPETSGFEVIAKLKENPNWQDIPVLFLTGWNDEKILAAAKEAGAADVIQKPIVPSILLESVKKHIINANRNNE